MLSWQIFLVPGKVGDTWHYLSDCENNSTICDSVYRQPSSNVKHLPNGRDHSHLLCRCWEKVGASLQDLGGLRGLLGLASLCLLSRGPRATVLWWKHEGRDLKWGTLNLEHCGQGQQMSQSSRGILMAERY